jgi:predicted SAM-dependent methyltransferase
MLKLHLGCGEKSLKDFVNIDIQKYENVDLIADIANLPFENNSVDIIYSCANLEHFGRNNNLKFFRNTCWKDVLNHWYSLLKKDGILYLSTADFESICKEYLINRNLDSLIGIALGGQKNEEDLHGMLFDFNLIKNGMENIGFKRIERYNWHETEMYKNNKDFDDFSRAYLPHMDFKNGRLMMLNIKGIK